MNDFYKIIGWSVSVVAIVVGMLVGKSTVNYLMDEVFFDEKKYLKDFQYELYSFLKLEVNRINDNLGFQDSWVKCATDEFLNTIKDCKSKSCFKEITKNREKEAEAIGENCADRIIKNNKYWASSWVLSFGAGYFECSPNASKLSFLEKLLEQKGFNLQEINTQNCGVVILIKEADKALTSSEASCFCLKRILESQ